MKKLSIIILLISTFTIISVIFIAGYVAATEPDELLPFTRKSVSAEWIDEANGIVKGKFKLVQLLECEQYEITVEIEDSLEYLSQDNYTFSSNVGDTIEYEFKVKISKNVLSTIRLNITGCHLYSSVFMFFAPLNDSLAVFDYDPRYREDLGKLFHNPYKRGFREGPSSIKRRQDREAGIPKYPGGVIASYQNEIPDSIKAMLADIEKVAEHQASIDHDTITKNSYSYQTKKERYREIVDNLELYETKPLLNKEIEQFIVDGTLYKRKRGEYKFTIIPGRTKEEIVAEYSKNQSKNSVYSGENQLVLDLRDPQHYNFAIEYIDSLKETKFDGFYHVYADRMKLDDVLKLKMKYISPRNFHDLSDTLKMNFRRTAEDFNKSSDMEEDRQNQLNINN